MAVTGANKNPSERNAEATVHIGQLDDKVTDDVLWELMQQASPVKHVYIPRDRITGKHFGYGFCEFMTPLDAAYANKVLNMVKLFGKPLRLSQSAVDRRSQDVGANLFVGNLSEDTDDKLLHDAFSTFGALIEPACIMRDAETGAPKNFGFVKYATFEAADAAVDVMHGQYIGNQPITVQFAFKKDGNGRERHGSQAERTLAKRARAANAHTPGSRIRQHTMFADGPPSQQTHATAYPTGQPAMFAHGRPPPQHVQTAYAGPPAATHSWLQGHAPVPAAYPAGAPAAMGAAGYPQNVGWAPRPAYPYPAYPQQPHGQMYQQPPQPYPQVHPLAHPQAHPHAHPQAHPQSDPPPQTHPPAGAYPPQ